MHGFKDKHEAQHRDVGETMDFGYVKHIAKMPRVSTGPGFLKMNFTAKMREVLLPWYAARVKDSVTSEGVIDGGYTNNHVIPTDHINLDNFRDVHAGIISEMRQVLQWWTQQELKHTQTFGVRIYHRDSMLINHVDRHQSHIASAVIQIHQETDEDGGWPLEVISDDGDCYEVFLQPGQMVLYEGGRFRHGRPMRFRGETFSNVFSHFAPMDWYGPKEGKEEL
jgi:prolyl 4-hydroxylase